MDEVADDARRLNRAEGGDRDECDESRHAMAMRPLLSYGSKKWYPHVGNGSKVREWRS